MPPVTSSPDVADQLLEVVGPGFATDWTLARGTNLSKIEIEEKRRGRKRSSYLDFGLTGSTDVVSNRAAVDRAVLLELIKTNLRNKALRELV